MRTALAQLYAQSVHSTHAPPHATTNRLVVSEDLAFVGVLNGAEIDFYDLAVVEPEDHLRAIKFLCSIRLEEPLVTAALDPHSPSSLAVGTSTGGVAFLRLRRTMDGEVPLGPLLVHKTLEKRLAVDVGTDASSAVSTIRFDPVKPGLCAAVCGGRVSLLQHDVGFLARAPCCEPLAASVCSVEWCGSGLLACGAEDGSVSMWRVFASDVDPRTPAVGLRVECALVGTLPPPEAAPVYGSVTAL